MKFFKVNNVNANDSKDKISDIDTAISIIYTCNNNNNNNNNVLYID